MSDDVLYEWAGGEGRGLVFADGRVGADTPDAYGVVPTRLEDAVEIAKALLGAHGIALRDERIWPVTAAEEKLGPRRRLVSSPIPEGES